VSDYQPRSQGGQPRPPEGWPSQPPASSGGQGQDQRRPQQPGFQPGRGSQQPGYQQGFQQPGFQQGFQQPGYQQQGYQQPSYSRPPARRRRRRWPIVLAVLVVIIVVVAVIGDQLARSYAQGKIADQIQSSASMSTKPSVSIKGWPFLTQVAARDLKEIDFSASNITASGSKVPVDIKVKATGVHVNSSFNGGTVDHITGDATIPFASASSALGLPGGTVALSADPSAGPNAVTASIDPIGSVTGTVKLTGPNEVTLTLDSGSGLGSIVSGLSGGSYHFTIPKLPSGLVVQSVGVDSQGITVQAAASNTTLSQ
jgi:hypothetical protein